MYNKDTQAAALLTPKAPSYSFTWCIQFMRRSSNKTNTSILFLTSLHAKMK
jgi:hypothetical protein